jgi:hypothetical protein
MSIFVAGLDLGQAADYSALVIVEAAGTSRKVSWEGIRPDLGLLSTDSANVETLPMTRLDVRHIERFPLHRKYGQIAADVEARLRRVPVPRYLVVDQTGVGTGVIEMLARLTPIGITITAGNEVQRGTGPQDFRVPKRDLVAALQVGLQNGTLRIAKGLPHAELLTREMLAFRARITQAGHDSYEAWREADHDDLVLAAALSCWAADLLYRIRQSEIQEHLAVKRAEALWRASMISPI